MVDMQLADRAHRALLNNPHLPHARVRLLAQQGRITLQGTVRSFYQKQMAQESLRDVEGVSEIENQLEVLWS
ncbi:MAG TPA: BON domain-containing protein [Pirellulales bacterium]